MISVVAFLIVVSRVLIMKKEIYRLPVEGFGGVVFRWRLL